MRPWRLVDETLQQLRRCNGAAIAPTGILHVGELRIDHLVVFRPKRHSPYPLTDFVADLDEPFGELVVIGAQTGIFMPQRDDDRAGHSAAADHELRLELLVP